MKVQLFLPATIIMSGLMVVLIKVRRDQKEELEKRTTFLDIKLRVSDDVLRQYANEKAQLKQDADTANDQYKQTETDIKPIWEAGDKAKLEAEKCAEEQVRGARIGELLGGRGGLCFPRALMRVSPPHTEIYER